MFWPLDPFGQTLGAVRRVCRPTRSAGGRALLHLGAGWHRRALGRERERSKTLVVSRVLDVNI